jgi:tRNA dimethylallyltransferase
MYNLVTVLGHTAGGKTRFAACLAHRTGGEIISADSRQVYRRMDLGTGKDYGDYLVQGHRVPVHLLDTLEPGYEYNVYEYQKDFLEAYSRIRDRGLLPVLCGGSGLYLEAVLRGYRLIRVPVNRPFRKDLEGKSMEELTALLSSFRQLHNITDTVNRKRLVRALEIEAYYRDHPELDEDYPELEPLILGICFDRETRRERITRRLHERLGEGMVEEVQALIGEGLPAEKLIYYGLEYKYITEYLQGKYSLEEMTARLETAIHRFAKRQMTWFRGMERRGIHIHWLEGSLPLEDKLEKAVSLLRNPTAPGSS